MNCPNCDAEMDQQEEEPDVNVSGGFFCHACEQFFPNEDFDLEA